MYLFLDYLFALVHTVLILFNLTGWIWKRTRKLHLYTISITLFSWFGLGLFYGWGYCPPVDWHWNIKRYLGETDLPASYVKYYADKLTGIYWNPDFIDITVLLLGLLVFVSSVYANIKQFKRMK